MKIIDPGTYSRAAQGRGAWGAEPAPLGDAPHPSAESGGPSLLCTGLVSLELLCRPGLDQQGPGAWVCGDQLDQPRRAASSPGSLGPGSPSAHPSKMVHLSLAGLGQAVCDGCRGAGGPQEGWEHLGRGEERNRKPRNR